MTGAWLRGGAVPRLCAAAAVVASCLVAAGSLLGVNSLVRPIAGASSMELPTAIALGL
jgi:hypothetical protein